MNRAVRWVAPLIVGGLVKKNFGTHDSVVRIFIALGVAVLNFTG